MFGDNRKIAIKICVELQDLLQKSYRDMDSSGDRATGIYRGESMAYKLAIRKIQDEFNITRDELSSYRRKVSGERGI